MIPAKKIRVLVVDDSALARRAITDALNRDPEIEGLYIVGAGTHPGAGLPGVINSAKATTRVILEDFAR